MKDLKLKAIFVVFLMTAIVWSSVLNYVGAEYGAPESSGFTSGNWCIEYDDEIERNNETIIVNGSLIINNSGILKLSNVNLKINSIENNIYKIWVKPGGTLFLSSTNICSYNQNYLYKFIVEGYMYMENCTINNVWGSSNNPQSGVQLNSDAEIYYSTINGSSGTGIYVNESNPTIQNTVISNCHYGIYCQSPLPILHITPSNVCILVNRTVQFNVIDGNSPYTWESTNTSVGTINSTGVFNSLGVGGCYVKVTDNNNKIGKALVQVIPDPYGLKLSPIYAILNINDDLEFNITNGTSPYNWTVDNSTVGSIDQSGSYIANTQRGYNFVYGFDSNNTTASGLVQVEIMSENDDKLLVTNNNFMNNEMGLVMNNSSPYILSNEFYSNNISIKFINSSSTIKSCKITNSLTYDFEMDLDSYPEIHSTSYDYTKISAPDNDNDSMPNYYETQYGLNQSLNDSGSDPDSDGLTNLQELQYGTDPTNADTDFDGMNDYDEIVVWGTNPFSGEEAIILDENLTIANNQTMILSNSCLVINSTSSETYGIYVNEGGSLYLNSTEISSYDGNYTYEFLVEGYMNMTKCTVNNVNGNSSEPGGIQLYSDSVIFDSEINNSLGTGIYINESNPMISNNTISNCYYGIYTDESLPTLKISNNTLIENEYGMLINDTSPYIIDNKFVSNNISFYLVNSNAKIEFCQIYNSTTYDLEIDLSSFPEIQYTIYDYSLISATDTDSDGMPDWYEDQYGLDKNDPNDANDDLDNDGLLNLEEYQYGTHPGLDDTDSDGLDDEEEINKWHTNPFRSDSDCDKISDINEIHDDIYWFEAEDNIHADGIGVGDPFYANDPKGDPTNSDTVKTDSSKASGGIIDVSLTNINTGKYLYYLKARLESGAPTDLKIKYNDGSDHYVTKTIFDNNYRWYKYDSVIQLNVPYVNLYAEDASQTGRLYVDKGVFMKVSDLSWEVTTTDDEDDTLEFDGGDEEIIVNLNIPIKGDVDRFVTKASMNIKGVSEETFSGCEEFKTVIFTLAIINYLHF